MRPELRYISSHERIVLTTGRHWVVLIRPALVMLVAIVVATVVGFLTGPASGSDWVDVVAGMVAIWFALRFVAAAARWARARIIVTATRIVQITGVVANRVVSLPLERVGGLSYERPPLGRLLGYGTVVLGREATGVGIPLEAVPAPDDLYRVLVALTRPGVAALLEDQLVESVPPDQADTAPIPRVAAEGE